MGDDATDYADVCDVLGLTISVMFSMYRQAQWPRLTLQICFVIRACVAEEGRDDDDDDASHFICLSYECCRSFVLGADIQ